MFSANGTENPVFKAAHKYQKHPSVLEIKEKYKDLNFSFSSLSSFNLKNKLKSLDTSKSVHETDVLTNILKENMDIFSPFFLLNYINDIIDSSSFPNHLKLSNLTPVNTHTHTHIHTHTHTHTQTLHKMVKETIE